MDLSFVGKVTGKSMAPFSILKLPRYFGSVLLTAGRFETMLFMQQLILTLLLYW